MNIFWSEILERFDKTSEALQKPGLDISTAVDLLSSLQGFVNSLRPLFDTFEARAHILSTIQCYQNDDKRIVSRRYPDGKRDCALQGREKFLRDLQCHTLQSGLCFAGAKGCLLRTLREVRVLKIADRSWERDVAGTADREVGENLQKRFRASIFSRGNSVFKRSAMFCMPGHECPRINAIENKLIHVFPNLSIALRIQLSIPMANCESEQSFSKL